MESWDRLRCVSKGRRIERMFLRSPNPITKHFLLTFSLNIHWRCTFALLPSSHTFCSPFPYSFSILCNLFCWDCDQDSSRLSTRYSSSLELSWVFLLRGNLWYYVIQDLLFFALSVAVYQMSFLPGTSGTFLTFTASNPERVHYAWLLSIINRCHLCEFRDKSCIFQVWHSICLVLKM